MNGNQYQRVISYPTGLAAGGFFSGIGKAIGSVAKVALPAVGTLLGGPIGGLVGGAVGRALGGGNAPVASPGGGVLFQGTAPVLRAGPLSIGGGGVTFSSGGGGGGGSCMTKDGRPRRVRRDGKCWKRPSMNPLNPRAARRAITRIKGARKILQSIEREMPHRKAVAKKRCGCK